MARITQLTVNTLKAPESGFVELWLERGLHMRASRKGKAWLLRYDFAGKRRRFELGRHPAMTLRDAQDSAAEARASLRKGIDPGAAGKAAAIGKGSTVRAVAEVYFVEHCDEKQRARTAEEVKRAFKLWILPAIGDLPLAGVTKGHLKELMSAVAKAGFKTQANRIGSYVRAFFNWCEDAEYIEVSPGVRLKLPFAEISRDRVLSDAEIVLFWRACLGMGLDGYPYGHLGRLLLLTGQRRNEAATLEWSELSPDFSEWTIPREKAKGKSTHDVHLSEPARSIIASVPREPSKFVFTRTGTTAVCGFSQAKRELDAHMTSLNDGEPVPPWRLHDLRRTAATVMTRSLKIPPPVADRVLAHKVKGATGVAEVYDRYLYLDERREALEKLGAYIEALVA